MMGLLLCLSVVTAGVAGASPLPGGALPGSIDPGRLGQQGRPTAVPASPQRLGTTTAQPAQSGDIVIPGADQILITLYDLKISGSEAYPEGHFLGLYLHLLGRPVTLQQVIDVVNRINATYREDGYIFSRAFLPEQDITSGQVKVSIVEGYIETVTLSEAPLHKEAELEPYLKKIRSVRPFNIKKYEHWLLSLNNLPGAKFRSVLKQPETKTPGGIDVFLIEEALPVMTTAEINNQGSQYAGPWQASLTHDMTGVFSDYDQLSLRLMSTIPTREVKYGQVSYQSSVLAVPGLSLVAQAGWGGTHSGSDLKSLEIEGLVREMRVGLSYAALLGRRTNWLMYLNLDAKNASSKILGDELYEDRLRVVRASTAIQHLDHLDGSTLATAELSQGLDILGARKTGSDLLSRADGHSAFTKISAQISRLQNLPHAFQILTQIAGQYAFDPLLSSEEFGFGGVPSGRGYDPSELTGDHGLSATLELRYNGLEPVVEVSFQPYAFLDFGKVWQKGDNAGNSVSALSAGLGTRIDYGSATSMNIMMGIPLTRDAGRPPRYANGESPRFMMSLRQTF